MWSLADAYTVPDIAWPRLIYDGDQLVGFIGAGHQRSGYGSFSVEGLCQEAVRRDSAG